MNKLCLFSCKEGDFKYFFVYFYGVLSIILLDRLIFLERKKVMIKFSKTVIIGVLLVVVLAIAISYANFTTQLTVNGNIEIIGDCDVWITDIKSTNISGLAVAKTPMFTKNSASFDIDLKKPGDAVTYTITIENKGRVDAVLSTTEWTPQKDSLPAIVYTYTNPSKFLVAGGTTSFKVTVTYNIETEGISEDTRGSINAFFKYIQAE